eukprot:UN20760
MNNFDHVRVIYPAINESDKSGHPVSGKNNWTTRKAKLCYGVNRQYSFIKGIRLK